MKNFIPLMLFFLGISTVVAQNTGICDRDMQDFTEAFPLAMGRYTLKSNANIDGLDVALFSIMPGKAAVMGADEINMIEIPGLQTLPFTVMDEPSLELIEGNKYSGNVIIPYGGCCAFGDDGYSYVSSYITTIAMGAFAKCHDLTSVTLPEFLCEIRRGAFYDCTSLTKVKYKGTKNVRIYPDAFKGCTSLRKIDLRFIGSVNYYGGRVFPDCPNLEEVYISAKHEEFRVLDRRTSPSIKIVRVDTENPYMNVDASDYCYYDPFFAEEYQNAILIVPEGSKDKYQNVLPWKNFANIMTTGEYAGVNSSIVGKEIVNLDGLSVSLIDYDATAEIFDTNGRQVAALTPSTPEFRADFPGIYLIRSGASTQKVVLQ